MARYRGSVCKICRRENTKLFLKGERCLTDKCAFERRPFPPGQRARRQRKGSEYSLQLREKQKTKRMYGLLEKQFKKYYELAVRQRGITGENLLCILETRLDNAVYRSGFAFSRNESRQLVRNGHIAVNNKRVTIPSYRVKSGDKITLTSAGTKVARIKEAAESSVKPETPAWLKVDTKKLTTEVVGLPTRDQIDAPVQENLIVELYSR